MGTSKYKESAKGVSYHLYNRGNRKQIIFEGEEDYRLYVNLFLISVDNSLILSLLSFIRITDDFNGF